MQHTLKDTAKNLESILLKLMNNFQLRYHPLFETFCNDVLLLDAETGVITDVSSNRLLIFSKLNEIPTAVQQMNRIDQLFLFDFDPNTTENQEEITLAGIDQLPVINR